MALPQFSFSQDKKIDQLEVLYSQKHFTKVLRKSNKLLAIPDYDYSGMPTFYKSLATFKLLSHADWTAKHKDGLSNAIALYKEFLEHSKVESYIKSHYFEIAELKQYLIDLEKQYKGNKRTIDAKTINEFLEFQLKNVTAYGVKIDAQVASKANRKDNKKVVKNKLNTEASTSIETREEMVTFAVQFIGTPYKWAGNSPSGFDCSGYIGYIYNNYGVSVPRSASALKENSTKISDKEATKGDLVFFKTGNKITHVGLVISEVGEPLTMIHSSTSKGIIKTEVHASTYWSKKYAGAGRILE